MKTTLVISGEQGSGKSHIMHVISATFLQEHPLVTISPDGFIAARKTGYSSLSIYAIDGVKDITQLREVFDILSTTGIVALITTCIPERYITGLPPIPFRLINLSRRKSILMANRMQTTLEVTGYPKFGAWYNIFSHPYTGIELTPQDFMSLNPSALYLRCIYRIIGIDTPDQLNAITERIDSLNLKVLNI